MARKVASFVGNTAGSVLGSVTSTVTIASENISGSSSVFPTFHSKLFETAIKNKEYMGYFMKKLKPDNITTGRICFKKSPRGNNKETVISIDDIQNYYFCAFVTGLQYSDDKDLLKNIKSKAVSLYELENCINFNEGDFSTQTEAEKIKIKMDCWKTYNALSIFTFGHFSRTIYTSRNILQTYTTSKKVTQKGGAKIKIEEPIMDLFTAWYNIIPWFDGVSTTIAGSSIYAASRLPRIPYHIDEEFSETKEGNIRVYNFLNQDLYMFYSDEFYKAYWLRRDINYNNIYYGDKNISDILDKCSNDNRPIECGKQEGGAETEQERQDEVIDLNPQPIRPKISYGDPINIEFKDKQKNPDEKPKIVKYEDPNIDLIPKIILKKDTVKN